MTIPIATVVSPSATGSLPVGFSLALDPGDNLLELDLTRTGGTMTFARQLQRLDPTATAAPISFTAHLGKLE